MSLDVNFTSNVSGHDTLSSETQKKWSTIFELYNSTSISTAKSSFCDGVGMCVLVMQVGI